MWEATELLVIDHWCSNLDSLQTSVMVQDEILNVVLTDHYHITSLDDMSRLFINIDQGTNVTYSITVNDGTDNSYILYHDLDNMDVPGEHLGKDSEVAQWQSTPLQPGFESWFRQASVVSINFLMVILAPTAPASPRFRSVK